jgi:hypothetical protein
MTNSKSDSLHTWPVNYYPVDMSLQHTASIIAGALTGTSMMTAYSYALSGLKNRQFKEPELLSILINRLTGKPDDHFIAKGWSLHYSVGLLFAAVYHRFWKQQQLTSLSSTLLLGAISGLIGISVWDIVLTVHPNAPQISKTKYFKQLFVAHLIFADFTWTGYTESEKLFVSLSRHSKKQMPAALQ